METDAERGDAEAGNLEQAWQMFDLAKVRLVGFHLFIIVLLR